MMAPAKLAFIPDLVDEHFDELQFLWTRRRSALRSPTCTGRALTALEERIAGHVDGLLVMGAHLTDFAEPHLAGEEEMPAFAAAFALLHLATPADLARAVDALETAVGDKLSGLRDAFAYGPAGPLAARLTQLVHEAPTSGAAGGAECLACSGAAAPAGAEVQRFLRAEEAPARASGWRLAGYCATAIATTVYETALHDPDATVARAALTAAAWNASPTVASYCRALAANPTPNAVEPLTLFAAIALPDEYQFVASVAADPAAGPDRFSVVGSFGHPYFIDLLIKEMENPDPASAVSAGNAFLKVTGRDVESNKRVKVSPDGKPPADEFEAEFQDEVFLPDPELARKAWQELAPTLARSPRICRGMDVSQPLSREQFALLDMESRWEYCLRMRLFSGWQGTPLVLERYPQRF